MKKGVEFKIYDEILIRELKGANMDIELANNVDCKQYECPWNKNDNTIEHKCAVKDMGVCKYFCGIKYLDTVLCSYPRNEKEK